MNCPWAGAEPVPVQGLQLPHFPPVQCPHSHAGVPVPRAHPRPHCGPQPVPAPGCLGGPPGAPPEPGPPGMAPAAVPGAAAPPVPVPAPRPHRYCELWLGGQPWGHIPSPEGGKFQQFPALTAAFALAELNKHKAFVHEDEGLEALHDHFYPDWMDFGRRSAEDEDGAV